MQRSLMAAAGLAMLIGAGGAAHAAPVCDGRHDATAPLNQMLAAGGSVRLPAGRCLVSASLFVPSGATVTGAGIGATVIVATRDPAFPVIAIGHGTPRTGARNVDLSGLSVDGGADRIGRVGGPNGIVVQFGSGQVRVHDVEVYRAGGNGIAVGTSDVQVEGTVVHDNFANGIYVIGKPGQGHPVRATNVSILRNRVTHNSLGGLPPSPNQTWDGIDVDPITGDVTVQGNVVTGNDILCLESGRVVASSGPCRVIDNVVSDSTENGIDLSGAIDGFEVTGNRISRVLGWGIVLNGSVRHGVVRGNSISGTSREGIEVHNAMGQPSPPTDVLIEGNTVAAGPGPQARAGIGVDQGASNVRVVANRILLRPGMAAIDTRRAGAGLAVQGNR